MAVGELITREGKEKLEADLRQIEAKLQDVRKDKAEAAADGNIWHDNPRFETAERDERMLMVQQVDLQKLLRRAKMVDDAPQGDGVQIGSRVEVEFLDDGVREVYTIRGVGESNPVRGIISHKSPLATALWDAREGETRRYQVGGQAIEVKIICIIPGKP